MHRIVVITFGLGEDAPGYRGQEVHPDDKVRFGDRAAAAASYRHRVRSVVRNELRGGPEPMGWVLVRYLLRSMAFGHVPVPVGLDDADRKHLIGLGHIATPPCTCPTCTASKEYERNSREYESAVSLVDTVIEQVIVDERALAEKEGRDADRE